VDLWCGKPVPSTFMHLLKLHDSAPGIARQFAAARIESYRKVVAGLDDDAYELTVSEEKVGDVRFEAVHVSGPGEEVYMVLAWRHGLVFEVSGDGSESPGLLREIAERAMQGLS